jgi:hypothetical protein
MVLQCSNKGAYLKDVKIENDYVYCLAIFFSGSTYSI